MLLFYKSVHYPTFSSLLLYTVELESIAILMTTTSGSRTMPTLLLSLLFQQQFSSGQIIYIAGLVPSHYVDSYMRRFLWDDVQSSILV